MLASQLVEHTYSNDGAGRNEGKIEVELKDLQVEQRHLLDTLGQLGRRVETRPNKLPVSDSRPPASLATNWADRRAP